MTLEEIRAVAECPSRARCKGCILWVEYADEAYCRGTADLPKPALAALVIRAAEVVQDILTARAADHADTDGFTCRCKACADAAARAFLAELGVMA